MTHPFGSSRKSTGNKHSGTWLGGTGPECSRRWGIGGTVSGKRVANVLNDSTEILLFLGFVKLKRSRSQAISKQANLRNNQKSKFKYAADFQRELPGLLWFKCNFAAGRDLAHHASNNNAARQASTCRVSPSGFCRIATSVAASPLDIFPSWCLSADKKLRGRNI